MTWIGRFALLLLMLNSGCKYFQPDDEDKKKSVAKDTESSTENTDTNTTKIDSDSDPNDPAINEPLSPIVVEGRELEEIAAALEAKRLQLEQQQRELIQREQMITRLEREALHKKDELVQLQSDTQKALAQAIVTVESQYKSEHDKLIAHWEKIKKLHKEFISKHLKYDESGKARDSLNPEFKRLQKERANRIDQLTKTIEGMNPASSAMMLTSMELEDAVEVMRELSNAKSAEILGSMAPQKAAEMAKGLMGPKIPKLPSIEDVELPSAPNAPPDNPPPVKKKN